MLTVVSPHEHSCYQGLDRMKRSGRVSERDTWMKEKIVGRGEAPRESDERGPATNPRVYVLAQRDSG